MRSVGCEGCCGRPWLGFLEARAKTTAPNQPMTMSARGIRSAVTAEPPSEKLRSHQADETNQEEAGQDQVKGVHLGHLRASRGRRSKRALLLASLRR